MTLISDDGMFTASYKNTILKKREQRLEFAVISKRNVSTFLLDVTSQLSTVWRLLCSILQLMCFQ